MGTSFHNAMNAPATGNPYNDLRAVTDYAPGSPENPYGYSTSPTRPTGTPGGYNPSKASLANEGIEELMKRNYNGTMMSWRPETRNYQLGNIYDYSVYDGRNNHRWGGEMNSSADPYSAAKAAADASNGKYLLGYYKPENWYYLYDNPDYVAPQQGTTEPSYTTDANGNPVNNGTTAGTMTSAITLDPHQQYLLNQQNAAKEQLTNALADYTGNIFNKAFNPQSEVGNPLSFRDAMGQIRTTDLSGDYKAANDFLSGASSVFDPAARAFANQLAYGKIPESDWAYRKQIQDALMDYQESRLNPTYAKQADQLATKLANQGITQGSDTYGSEWDIYNRAKNDAYQNAYNNAITLGEQAIQNQFNRDLAAYQQVGRNYNIAAQMKDLATDNLHNVYNLDVQQNAAANNAALGLMNASTNQVQQKYQQSLATRQQQMNELMTLMNLTAPTNPTFSHQQTAGNIGAGDYIGAATGLYGGLGGAAANGAGQAAAAEQSRNNLFGDLIGAAGLFGFGKLFG